jgi:hypothetical protein
MFSGSAEGRHHILGPGSHVGAILFCGSDRVDVHSICSPRFGKCLVHDLMHVPPGLSIERVDLSFIKDIHGAFIDLRSHAPTNKVVGALFPTNRMATHGVTPLPPAVQKAGFRVIEPGRYGFHIADVGIQRRRRRHSDRDDDASPFHDILDAIRPTGFHPRVVTVGAHFCFRPQ